MNVIDIAGETADVALVDLLSVVLRECARRPRLLAGLGAPPRTGLVRVAAAPRAAAVPFTTLLVDVFDEQQDALTGFAVQKLGSRTEAEDVVQSAFMRVFARKPDIARPDKLRAYLWTVVRNLTNDTLRHIITDRANTDRAGEAKLGLLCERAGLPLDDVIALRELLVKALDTLSPREREAVVLRGYGGYPLGDVAEIMGIAPGTVKSYLHHGFARIREALERS